MKVSNPPFSAQLFQAVYGAQPQLVGASPSYYDFVTGSLPSGVALTRASSGWRYNSAGLLVSETTNAPRFHYDPSTLTPRGLLIEEARTELTTYNGALDDASWSKLNSSVAPDGAVAPDGTTTMDKLVEDGVNTSHSFRKSTTFYSFTAGTSYQVSMFARADTRGWIYIALPSAAFGSTLRTWFDVGSGAAGTTAAGVAAFIQSLGGGLYRCSLMATATVTAASTIGWNMATADGALSYAGDGTSGLFIWGVAVQAGDCVTSHVPTAASAVTRAADIVSVTNANALADQCWVVKGRTPRKIGGGAVNVAFQVDDGSANNRRSLRYGTDGKLHAIATVGGVDQCDLDLGSVANDTDFAVAIRWADNNFAASLNGGAIVADLSGSNPLGLTTARIGCGSSGNYWNSTIRTLETRRTASDTELPLLAA